MPQRVPAGDRKTDLAISPRTDGLPLLLAAAIGFAVSWHYAWIGFMPLDQSIVFDGAWRVLSGQVPLRDFATPNGFVPILLQVPFFRILGPSWSAYALHAALIDALFACTGYLLLRLLGGARRVAFLYALFSGLVFSPPMGVPYLEQHAFFFGLLAVASTVAAAKTRHLASRAVLWTSVPLFLLLAYLSKQIPTVYFPPLIVGWMAYRRIQLREAVPWLLLGTALGVGTVALAVVDLGIDPRQAQLYVSELPGRLGQERLQQLLVPEIFIERVGATVGGWGLTSVFLLQLLVALALAAKSGLSGWSVTVLRAVSIASGCALVLLGLFAGGLSPLSRLSVGWLGVVAALAGARMEDALSLVREMPPAGLARLALAEGMLVVCCAFVLTTRQDPANGIPFVFVQLGLVHLAVARIDSHGATRETSRILIGILLATAAIDAISFDRRVNAPRAALNLAATGAAAAPSVDLPPELRFLEGGTPAFYGTLADDLPRLLHFLRQNSGNFLLIGDSSILYGLTGRPSVHPALFSHPGLTTPPPGTRAYAAVERALRKNLQRFDVRFLVLEGDRTWNYDDVDSFEIPFEACRSYSFGIYHVLERCR